MSRRAGETLFALMFLPITFPGVLLVLALDKLFDRLGKARLPERISFPGSLVFTALFWWTMSQLFDWL